MTVLATNESASWDSSRGPSFGGPRLAIQLFRAALPIERVQPDAPPFLVVHGSDDGLIPVTEARQFVERMRSLSASTVAYVELPGAGHGFDLTDGVRTASVNAGIGPFLQQVHEDRVEQPAEFGCVTV